MDRHERHRDQPRDEGGRQGLDHPGVEPMGDADEGVIALAAEQVRLPFGTGAHALLDRAREDQQPQHGDKRKLKSGTVHIQRVDQQHEHRGHRQQLKPRSAPPGNQPQAERQRQHHRPNDRR